MRHAQKVNTSSENEMLLWRHGPIDDDDDVVLDAPDGLRSRLSVYRLRLHAGRLRELGYAKQFASLMGPLTREQELRMCCVATIASSRKNSAGVRLRVFAREHASGFYSSAIPITRLSSARRPIAYCTQWPPELASRVSSLRRLGILCFQRRWLLGLEALSCAQSAT